MITRVVMPKLTDTMEEGVLVTWKKEENDVVSAGDVLAEIETDKAVMDLEAFGSGLLRKKLAEPSEVDLSFIHIGLRKIRVDGHVQRELGRDQIFCVFNSFILPCPSYRLTVTSFLSLENPLITALFITGLGYRLKLLMVEAKSSILL